MSTAAELTVAQRLYQLYQHLGLKQAHVGAGGSDWQTLANNYPELLTSLTLICPGTPNPENLQHLDDNLLVFTGASGDEAARELSLIKTVSNGSLTSLDNVAPWSDILADNADSVLSTMLPFLARTTRPDLPVLSGRDGEVGQVAGITYYIQGAGPPLILFPLGLIPSQWEPIMAHLAKHYCTITLGGDKIGMVALLETRSREAGYLGMVRNLIEEIQLQPGESVMEVGCGTGALSRFLVRHTGRKNPVTGLDINGYLLREAAALARSDKLDDYIHFQQGNAEALAIPDNSFDVTFSVTVMEEVDAAKMLAEMVRVTKPGGRVAVIVRAVDRPFLFNLPLSPELKAKVEDPTDWAPGVGPKGCADASLYQRFQETTLTRIKMFPFLATFTRPDVLAHLHNWVQVILSPEEAQAYQTAQFTAKIQGTDLIAYPHHCAVGTKPD